MATVQRSASRIAWSVKEQTAFGTALVKTDLNRFLRLADPLIINENAEHWSNRGTVGPGHEWETQRGRLRQFVKFEIPVQPLPADFVGFLLALFFSDCSSVDQTGYYEHASKFPSLGSRPEARVTTLAVLEDGNDYYLQDVACLELTLKGDGANRLEAGGSFVASRIGGTLSSYTWPSEEPLRFLFNYAGLFELDDTGKRSQLRSFTLSLEAGIDMDLAWQKAASEAERVFPSLWPYTPERKAGLDLELVAESGDLAAFRQAQQSGTEVKIELSCLGAQIGETGACDTVEITLPKAVYTSVDHGFDKGLLHIRPKVDLHYDSSTGGPLSVKTVNSVPAYFPGS